MMDFFTINNKLITLNEYIKIERGNRFGASSIKKKNTDICAKAAHKLNPLPHGMYDLEIIWNVTDNRTDADNIYFACKFILDGLKKAGKIKDDSRKYIRNISNKINTTDKYSIIVNFFKI